MKNRRILFPLLPAVLFAFLWVGCEKDYNYVVPKKTSTGGGNNGGPVDSVHYKITIEPLWATYGCSKSGCHSGSLDLNLLVGSSYQSLMDVGSINTGNPTGSDLYTRINAPSSDPNFMPEGGSPMSAADIDKILTWIQQGANNN